MHYKMKRAVRMNAPSILRGNMLCIDPGSKYFGWAYYREGKLVASGSEDMTGDTRYYQDRLKRQVHWIGEYLGELPIDLMVLERPYDPSYTTVVKNYMRLIQSIGLFLALVPYDYYIDIRPTTWQDYTRPEDGWVKGDETDAIQMGVAMIRMAGVALGGAEQQQGEEARAVGSDTEHETVGSV